ncbi:MAG: hypothetical protein KME47_09650 [Nodosilinea sp. WJT8-NPBG4]|nr:hypothetical protein [Nodosilinea sp. WJT8-NPBG4]
MPVNALSIAKDGIGYGSLAVAKDGFTPEELILIGNYLGAITSLKLIQSSLTTFEYHSKMATEIETTKFVLTTLEIRKAIETKIESIKPCLTTFESIKGSTTQIWQD